MSEYFATRVKLAGYSKHLKDLGKYELNLLNVRIFYKCENYLKDSPDMNLLNV